MRGFCYALLASTLFGGAGNANDTAMPGGGAGPAVTVALETDRGTILLEVYPQAAPLCRMLS